MTSIFFWVLLILTCLKIYFTDVFPLDKVYHLWDKFMVGPPSLPLFVGVAILRQIRDDLLKYEFNGCISLFSEHFPKIDIEKCIQSAMNMCKVTPPSIVSLRPIISPTTNDDDDDDDDDNKVQVK